MTLGFKYYLLPRNQINQYLSPLCNIRVVNANQDLLLVITCIQKKTLMIRDVEKLKNRGQKVGNFAL